MAQFTISGTVTDNGSNAPLAGATVRIQNISATGTDASGNYKFKPLKGGNYLLEFSFVGYLPVQKEVRLSQDQMVNISLQPSAFLAEEVLVQATRASQNAAVTYKNITKDALNKNNFGQDLPFLLDNTPGVTITSDAGAGIGYTGIRIRGSDATRVNVTLNGIPYNDSESQGTFWVNMPDFASSVENIQIQRGIGTSTNGAGAFGGSLNIQTSGSSIKPFAELNNSFGSFNTLKNTVKVGSGLIADKFSFEGRLSRIKSDGFVDRGKSDLRSFFLSGSY
ncbi:MAG: TonB-dependent receptor, partial [Pedobacter sp.]